MGQKHEVVSNFVGEQKIITGSSKYILSAVLCTESLNFHNPVFQPFNTRKSKFSLLDTIRVLSILRSISTQNLLRGVKGTGTRDLIWLKVVSLERS